jgi:hypothetical protein
MSKLFDIQKTKIPFLSVPDSPIVSTTIQEIPIADITDNMVIYKDGSAAIVLESTSLNFGLLSENEQEAVIASYAGLLNSLSFSIQILIRSQRKDISQYMQYLEVAFQKAKNPKVKSLMTNYKNFISETIKKKNVLGKKFFIILMFSSLELGVTKSFLATTKRKGPLPFTKSYVIKKAKTALMPKKDHIVRQCSRLGLKLRQLTSNELIELFYTIYNPTPPLKTVEETMKGEENETF